MRILFITSNRIGDSILSTGILNHLINKYPQAKFTIATGQISAPLFGGMPNLSQIILMPKKKFGLHWFDLWRKTVMTRWDMIIDLRRSAICYILWSKKFYIQPKAKKNQHRVELLASTLGLTKNPPSPKLWCNPAHIKNAEKLIPNDAKTILAIGPTANWAGKIWPAENFAALIKILTKDNAILENAHIVVFGANNERLQSSPVLRSIDKSKCIDLVGKVDLLTAFACMQRCDLYIGNDSGLMHMAASAGIKTLGLFGPSKTKLYAPWGDDCAFIRTVESFDELTNAPDYDHRTTETLMNSLSVDAVATKAINLWNGNDD